MLQGYAWLWRRQVDEKRELEEQGADEIDPTIGFYESNLPRAYLALLNSKVFESLLFHFCSRVQGGQFNLSTKFVRNIPLPDLTDDNSVSADDVRELEQIGFALESDQPVDFKWLTTVATHIYGIPVSEWNLGDAED